MWWRQDRVLVTIGGTNWFGLRRAIHSERRIFAGFGVRSWVVGLVGTIGRGDLKVLPGGGGRIAGDVG